MIAPLIRACLLGFMWLNTHDGAIVEKWQARPANITLPPFQIISGVNNSRQSEFSEIINGTTYCQWIIVIVANNGENPVVSVNPEIRIDRIQATTFNPYIEVNVWNPSNFPCDINLIGGLNVLDYMDFLNHPYDWNCDGVFNIFDYMNFLNCR